MRIASNKLKDMIDFYHSELRGVYEETEIVAMLNTAVEEYLGYSKTELLSKTNENINQSDLLKLYDCAKDLKKNIPLQYILKNCWFYNLRFFVNPSVLIPRPETEELVDIIVKENKNANSFLDIGTGSGCIPISIKKHLVSANVSACDISIEALCIAEKNATQNEVAISFFEADALNTNEFENEVKETFDVIISNPPYIKEAEKKTMSSNVLHHEPDLALFVNDPEAIIFYKRIIDFCKTKLNSKGKLYFELNPLTAEDVKIYAISSKLFDTVELLKDMSGKIRLMKAVKF